MALGFHSGFEMGDFGEWSSVVGSPNAVETQKKTGDYAMRCNPSAATAYVSLAFAVGGSKRQVSFYLYVATAPGSDIPIVGNETIGSIRLTSDRHLDLVRSGTVVGTSTTQLILNTWYRVSSSIGSASESWLAIDGTKEIEDVDVQRSFGDAQNDMCIGAIESCSTDLYFDDVVIATDFSTSDLGDIRVAAASPNAVGTYAQYDTSSGYTNVDEIPANDADFIEDNGADAARESYNIPNLAALDGASAGDTINAVSIWIRGDRDGGGATDHKTMVRDNGSDYESPAHLFDGIAWFNWYLAVMPDDSAAWSEARLNSLEIGAYHLGGQDQRVHCLVAMVAYTVAVGGIQLSITDGLKAGDTPSQAMSVGLSVTDGLKGGDTLAKLMTAGLSITEGLKGGDTSAPIGALSLSDGTKLGENSTPLIELLASLSLTDGIELGDTTLLTLAAYFLSLTEGIKLGDSSSMQACLALTEGMKIGEQHHKLYDYYNVDDDFSTFIYGTWWMAQSFTTTEAYKVVKVRLKVYYGGSPGDLTVSIRATTDGKPTGGDLCSVTVAGTSLPNSSPGDWVTFTFSQSYNLLASTKYAIVLGSPTSTENNCPYWRLDDTSPAYAGGNQHISANSGVDWDNDFTDDFMFEVYGEVSSPLIDLLAYLSLSDGLKLGDTAVLSALIYYLSITDGLKGGDSTSLLAKMYLALTDGVKAGDTLSILSLLSLAEGLKLGDSNLFGLTALLALTDGVKTGDSSAVTMLANLLLSDGVKLGDSAILALLIYLTATDGLKLGDTRSLSAQLSVTDGLKLGDALSLLMTSSISITDGVKFGDTNVVELAGAVFYLSLTEGVKLGDTLLASMLANITLSDGTKLGDLASIVSNLQITDGVKLGDTTLRELIATLSLSDDVKFGDSNALAILVNLTLSDGVRLGDSARLIERLVKLWLFAKTFHDVRMFMGTYHDVKVFTETYHDVIIWTGGEDMIRRNWQRGETVPIWAEVKLVSTGALYSPNQGVKLYVYDPDGTVLAAVNGEVMAEDSTGMYVYYWNSASDSDIGWYRAKGHAQDGTGAEAKITIENGGFELGV